MSMGSIVDRGHARACRSWRWTAGLMAAGLAILTGALPGSAAVPKLDLQLVAEGFNSPVHLDSPPDGSGRRFVVDRAGLIYIITREGKLLEQPFLDVRDRMVPLNPRYDERGLLGLAFHPDYAKNGRFYVYYSVPLRSGAPEGWNHTSRVSEFTVSASDPNRADPRSERVILEVDQPQSNHNAGALAFGPDGYLYIALGDGGQANDSGLGHPPLGNGQDVTTLLGSILRIAVEPGRPGYQIPPDNPFVGKDGRDEIYAWGFRNPFRMSFDRGGSRALFVADVGQNLWEEVNIVTGPGNYGWRLKEATHCFDPANPSQEVSGCPKVGPRGEPLIDPILEYPHRDGNRVIGISIIGGYVYRGQAIPELVGKYVYGDWSGSFASPSGKLFVASSPASGQGMWTWQEVMSLDGYVLGMGQDDQGELYVLTTRMSGPSGDTGRVYRIVPGP